MKKGLDRLTGSVTMYRLVILLLSVVAAVALVLSLLGQIGYTVLELLATLIVSIVATMASGWLVPKAFRLKPHLESSLITALLIFFVVFPTTDPIGLAWIALVGVVASLSKYLLAIRGRHIFNPTAVGVVVVGLFGVATEGWWVATPPLLPFVLIGAFLVLYRTQKLAMGFGFMALAFVLLFIANVSFSGDPLAAAWLVIGSFPIVFLGGFMLSEPLTLPPRRWQQFLVAAIVAVIFALPTFAPAVLGFSLSIGTFFVSYAVALLIGNAVAFAFGQRRGLRLRLLGRRQLTPTTWEFRFEPLTPVTFQPGQYMELTLPHRPGDARGHRRIFSIASAPDDGTVTFGVKFSQTSSTFKSALAALPDGTQIRATSVGGDFVLPSDPTVPVLLVAGGIGITPFISQLEEARRRDTVVVYAVSSAAEIAFADELGAAGVPVLLVAPESPATLPPSWRYLGSDRVTAELLQREVPGFATRHAYVSGPPALVTDLKTTLKHAGLKRIVTDYFTGY